MELARADTAFVALGLLKFLAKKKKKLNKIIIIRVNYINGISTFYFLFYFGISTLFLFN